MQAENTSNYQRISSSPEPEPQPANHHESQGTKKRCREITASDLARTLLKEERANRQKHKKVQNVVIEDHDDPETSNTEEAVSSTPRDAQRARRRFKKYDVTAKRRVINPLLELEDDSPEEVLYSLPYNEFPSQVVEFEEGSKSLKEMDALLLSDLERQLKNGDNEDEVDETGSQKEEVSQAENEVVEEIPDMKVHGENTRESKEKCGKMDIVDIVDVTEVASWDLDGPEVEEVESRSESPAVHGDVLVKNVVSVETGSSDPSKDQERRESISRNSPPKELAEPHLSDSQKEEGPQKDGTAQNDKTIQEDGNPQKDIKPQNDGKLKDNSLNEPSHADSPQTDQNSEKKSESPNRPTNELPKVNKALLKERLKKAKSANALTPYKTPKVNKTVYQRRSKTRGGFGTPLTRKVHSGKLPNVNKELLKERLRRESEESLKAFGSPDQPGVSGVLPKVNRALLQQRLHRTQGTKEDGGSNSKVIKALPNQKLRKVRKPRELHRDASGKWTKEADLDADVILLGEAVDSGSSQETPNQVSKGDDNLQKNVAENLDKSAPESSPIRHSLNNGLSDSQTEASGSEKSKAVSSKTSEVRVKTEVFLTPIRPTNRYPIAPALAPGGGFGGLPLLISSTDPPTSRTTIIPSRTSAIESGGSLPNLVRQAQRPDSERSPTLFVSQDSPSSAHTYKAPSTASSPLHRGLNRNRKLLLSLPRSHSQSYEKQFSSQTNSVPSSQSKDQLLVPESSVILPGREIPLSESHLTVSSQKEAKNEVTPKKPAETKSTKRLLKAGTLPSTFKPATPDPSTGQNKRIKLNPMYHKVMTPVPVQRKSLAQQLKDRRKQLEKSVKVEKA